jgi:hypothetical protein
MKESVLIDMNHAVHQINLERKMREIQVLNKGTRLTVQDYARKLGIESEQGIENIREVVRTGRFGNAPEK